jgi:hypothetical protein
MQGYGNQCGCGRMAFSVQDVAWTNPEDKTVTYILPNLVLGTCLGCGCKLYIGKGEYRFSPTPPNMPAGRDILSKAIDDLRESLEPKKAVEVAPAEVTV